MKVFSLKVVYCKGELLRFISHRDLTEVIKKAIVRAELPVTYSKGYNPRPRISFYNPLQVGVESNGELFVFQAYTYVKPEIVERKLNSVFPPGITCKDVVYIKSKKSLIVVSSDYSLPIKEQHINRVKKRLEEIKQDEVFFIRKRNNKKLDIARSVKRSKVSGNMLFFSIVNNPDGTLSPLEFLTLIFEEGIAKKELFNLKRYRIEDSSEVYG